MPDLSIGSSQIYTMRELNQDTANVIRKINETGRPAAITRHGRFVALITPLLGRNVEGKALEAVMAEQGGTPHDQAQGRAVLEGASPAEDFLPND